jgi:hypothetical protein
MIKRKILVQLDSDHHASVFDAVVAVDAGVNQLLQYAAVQPDDVRGLVHGAMFTRGPQDLRYTALFIGGSDAAAGETLLKRTLECFFGPMRVSVLLDANGANTTAAAAVLTAAKHVPLSGAKAVVLGGTGPVGQRAARLLAKEGAEVRVASRSIDRSQATCQQLQRRMPNAHIAAAQTASPKEVQAAIEGAAIIIAAGAAGVELLTQAQLDAAAPMVAIDLNAVPPSGIGGIQAMDRGAQRGNTTCYGAIGVGGLKMKIHKAALGELFERNDAVLDAEEIYAIGQRLVAQSSG